ncbi:MAG: phage tail assembly chaperone [Rhodobacteraceae bacterium]|nr:phage tail assembly chaperone [Paracoccaceae bacterium]
MQFKWVELMRLGMLHLQLSPDQFWALTPAELVVMSGADAKAAAVLTRSGLDALMVQYPDKNLRSEDG